MFPARYFPDRYFAPRYFVKTGMAAATIPDFEFGSTMSLLSRYATESQVPEYLTESLQPRLTTDPLF